MSHDVPPADRVPSRLPPLLLAGLWVASLGTLAVVSANPVTLNRDQILASGIVVSATIDDRASGACTVRDVWRGPVAPGASITVRSLPAAGVREHATYILPLSPGGGTDFEVTPAKRVPGAPRLVYPATRDVPAQLEKICGR